MKEFSGRIYQNISKGNPKIVSGKMRTVILVESTEGRIVGVLKYFLEHIQKNSIKVSFERALNGFLGD